MFLTITALLKFFKVPKHAFLLRVSFGVLGLFGTVAFIALFHVSFSWSNLILGTLSYSAFFNDSSYYLRAFKFWFLRVLGKISVTTDL